MLSRQFAEATCTVYHCMYYGAIKGDIETITRRFTSLLTYFTTSLVSRVVSLHSGSYPSKDTTCMSEASKLTKLWVNPSKSCYYGTYELNRYVKLSWYICWEVHDNWNASISLSNGPKWVEKSCNHFISWLKQDFLTNQVRSSTQYPEKSISSLDLQPRFRWTTGVRFSIRLLLNLLIIYKRVLLYALKTVPVQLKMK